MPFAGNLRTLPLPDVLQTLNNIKATGVLRLRSSAGARDVVFQQGEIIGVGFLDKEGREDLELRLTLLAIDEKTLTQRMQGVTWYWSAMQARSRAGKGELDELVHEQAREQLHNLFAWNTADFDFDDAGPGKEIANEMVARCLERPLSIDTATLLLEAARQQDEWAELRARIRDEAGAAAMGSQPAMPVQQEEQTEDPVYHLYLDGEWRGPFPRSEIIGLVQTGEVPTETWSYDPRTQERETLDVVLGAEARRITPEELDALRQAVRAAEARLAEERAGRSADLAEMRGLAGEVLRVAKETAVDDDALSAVVGRLSEAMAGDDPSLVALAAETVVVSLIRHLREGAGAELVAAKGEASKLAERIAALEKELSGERERLDAQLAEAERRADSERAATGVLRERLAAAAEDAARLDQELERMRRDPSRVSTARISALKTPEDVAAARAGAGKPAQGRSEELEREVGRMRAEHARLLNEIATLQTRLDEEHARHEAELEASRALAATLGEQSARPPAEAEFQAEIERLKRLLAEAETKAGSGSDLRRAVEERERAAAERDAARGDTQRLRRDLHQARAEAARVAELAARAEASDARLAEAEERARLAEDRLRDAEGRLRSTESDLAEARAKLEAAERARVESERQAYESARQNTQLQVRLREFATRLDDGERRLAEFGDLAGQLAEARARAASLADEGQRIRADLATVREQATGRLDRARERIAQLKGRLRTARRTGREAREARDASAARAAVPWPSPVTAMYAAAPPQPVQPVPWPSPATAMFVAPQPAPMPAPMPVAAAPAPAPIPAPAAAIADSALQRRDDDRIATARMGRAPSAGRAWRWAAAAAVVVLVVAGLWAAVASSLPVSDRALVNARLVRIPAAIPGNLTIDRSVYSEVRHGDRVGELRNPDLDKTRIDALKFRQTAVQDRQRVAKQSLDLAQAGRDRLAQELAAKPQPTEAETRLRDEYGMRVIELQNTLDDLRQRDADLASEIANEQARYEQLRQADVKSPVDGVLWSVAGNQPLQSGAEVCAIADDSSVVVEADIDAAWNSRIQPGQPAKVRIGDNVVEARVREKDPQLAASSGYIAQQAPAPGFVRVLLEIPDPQDRQLLKLGRPVRVAIPGQDPGLLTRLAMAWRF